MLLQQVDLFCKREGSTNREAEPKQCSKHWISSWKSANRREIVPLLIISPSHHGANTVEEDLAKQYDKIRAAILALMLVSTRLILPDSRSTGSIRKHLRTTSNSTRSSSQEPSVGQSSDELDVFSHRGT